MIIQTWFLGPMAAQHCSWLCYNKGPKKNVSIVNLKYCKLSHFFSFFYCKFNYELRDQRVMKYHNKKLDIVKCVISSQDFIFITQSATESRETNDNKPYCTCKICSDGRTSVTHVSTHFVHPQWLFKYIPSTHNRLIIYRCV